MNRYYLKLAIYIFLLIAGFFIFIYGGYDDSPGAQLLGLVIFLFALFKIIKDR